MGFSHFRVPEYLHQTNTGLLVFRMSVPLDCRPTIQKNEIQYSLKTRCIYSARKRIASILPFLREVFEGIRQGMFSAIAKADLDKTIKEGIHQAIREPLINHRITIVTNPIAAHQAEPASAEIKDTQFPPAPSEISPNNHRLSLPQTPANIKSASLNLPSRTLSATTSEKRKYPEIDEKKRRKTMRMSFHCSGSPLCIFKNNFGHDHPGRRWHGIETSSLCYKISRL